MFLRSYLQNVHRAVSEGYPLIGYIHWSLMDNFEWTWASRAGTGITRVDFTTLGAHTQGKFPAGTRLPSGKIGWYNTPVTVLIIPKIWRPGNQWKQRVVVQFEISLVVRRSVSLSKITLNSLDAICLGIETTSSFVP